MQLRRCLKHLSQKLENRNERNIDFISCAINLPLFSQRAHPVWNRKYTHVDFPGSLCSANAIAKRSPRWIDIRRGRPSATRKKKRIILSCEAGKRKKTENEPRCIGFYSAIRAHTASSLELIPGQVCACGFAIEERSRGRWMPRDDQTLVATISHSFLQPALFRQSFFLSFFVFSVFLSFFFSTDPILSCSVSRGIATIENSLRPDKVLECLSSAFRTIDHAITSTRMRASWSCQTRMTRFNVVMRASRCCT